jgi:iron complex outermembrane receptor protein
VALISHIVGNLDITKVLPSDKTSIGFGSEIRNETFEIFEGGKASWDGFVPIHFR